MSTKIKRGMLIRNLRETDDVDLVLSAKGAAKADDALLVATRHNQSGVTQHLTDYAEVRWPWEPETAWRRVIG